MKTPKKKFIHSSLYYYFYHNSLPHILLTSTLTRCSFLSTQCKTCLLKCAASTLISALVWMMQGRKWATWNFKLPTEWVEKVEKKNPWDPAFGQKRKNFGKFSTSGFPFLPYFSSFMRFCVNADCVKSHGLQQAVLANLRYFSTLMGQFQIERQSSALFWSFLRSELTQIFWVCFFFPLPSWNCRISSLAIWTHVLHLQVRTLRWEYTAVQPNSCGLKRPGSRRAFQGAVWEVLWTSISFALRIYAPC